jgi:hypothetical protein
MQTLWMAMKSHVRTAPVVMIGVEEAQTLHEQDGYLFLLSVVELDLLNVVEADPEVLNAIFNVVGIFRQEGE